MGDFERLDAGSDLPALIEAVEERERREVEMLEARFKFDLRRDARLFSLLCNLLGGGKKTWTEKDFLAEDPGGVPPESEEARQAIDAYRAKVAERRGKRGG